MSEVLILRVNEACTKKVKDSKLKEIEVMYKAPENCDFFCVCQRSSLNPGLS